MLANKMPYDAISSTGMRERERARLSRSVRLVPQRSNNWESGPETSAPQPARSTTTRMGVLMGATLLCSAAALSVVPRAHVFLQPAYATGLPLVHAKPTNRFASSVMMSQNNAATKQNMLVVLRDAAPRVASATAAAAVFILGRSAMALAASSGVVAKTNPVNVVKIGVGVGGIAIACAAYMISNRKTPATAAKSSQRNDSSAPPDDDALLLMDLSSRMQSFSNVGKDSDNPEANEPSVSTDGRGEGSTGLLEAPRMDEASPSAPAGMSDIPVVDKDFLENDALVLGDLAKRMRELAESPEPKPEPDPPTVDDSSDEWSRGNTAVLEPPRPRDDAPKDSLNDPDEFPEGFPLRDFANEPMDDKPPAPSEEEIAMLKRMFGTTE